MVIRRVPELVLGRVLRTVRHVWPSDRFLWPLGRLALAGRPNRRDPERLRTADGFEMMLRPKSYPDGAMYFGCFELATVRLLRKTLRLGDRAVDVGANIGYMSLQMARIVGASGEVHALEPLPETAARLRDSVAANSAGCVVVHECGAGSSAGFATLYSLNQSQHHAQTSMRPLSSDAIPVTCRIERLDDLIPRPIKLLKVDVEGAEVGVLEGARELLRDCHPHLIVEHNEERLRAFGTGLGDVVAAIEGSRRRYRAVILDGRREAVDMGSLVSRQLDDCNIWFRPEE